MRITNLHVDGYGALSDYSLDELAPGLTVVLGANEAGKSTLLDFLRGVLFGFPDRRQRRAYHEPLHGGRHGGSLGFLDDAGRHWSLERFVDTRRAALTGPDGAPVNERELAVLLGGADDALFRSVFAFGLTELAAFESLDTDEVRDLVFSAGVLGAGRSATRAARALDQARATLVRQRQPDAVANQLRVRLESVETALTEARQAADGYRGAAAEGARLRDRLDGARRRAEELHRRGLELERIISSWPIARRAEETLSELTAIGEEKPGDAAVREASPEIRRLSSGLSGHDERRRRLEELTLDATTVAAEQAAELAGLCAPGSPPPSFDPSAESEAAGLALRARERRAELTSLEQHEALARRELEQSETDLALESERNSARPSGELREIATLLGELREALTERDRLRRDLESAARDAARDRAVAASRRDGQWTRPVTVLGALGLAAIAIAAATRTGAPTGLRVALGVLGVLAVLVASTALRRPGRAPQPTAPAMGLEEALAMSEERVAGLATRLGVDAPISAAKLEAAARDLDSERFARARLDELGHAQRLASARARLAAEHVAAARHALDGVEVSVREACRRIGLSEALDADGLVRALTSLRRVAERDAEQARVRAEMDLVGTAIATFETSVGDLERRLGAEPDTRLGVATRLERLEERLAAALAQHEARGGLETVLEDSRRLLNEALGTGQAAEALREELSTGSVLAWDEERRLLAGQIAAADAECEAELGALHEHERALHELATSTTIAQLELEHESLSLALDEALQRWLVLSHAKALLEETLAGYERDRQPAVIARASALFAEVTDGRYVRLVAREDHDAGRHRGIDALGPHGERVDSAQLSRGTAEQLYLCLRLAFAATFAERAVSLPLVLDDVLVNFDPTRAAAVARAVARTAEAHQVLAFTCHPHLVEHFRQAGTDVRVVELRSGGTALR